MKHSLREIIAVVPAAGIGSRMQADKPKQYLKIQEKTILEHTLEVLIHYPAISQIIVAVTSSAPYLAEINLLNHSKIQLVEGGKTRAESVLNGLQQIKNNANTWVMVHDAARPCLTHQDLDKLLQINDINGAILAIPVVDTIKRANSSLQIQQTEDRSQLWLAQTPQFFPTQTLKHALQQALANDFTITDEASAMELMGFRPQLIPARSDNIKITRPEDLALAEFYLSRLPHLT
ncbi:2-C-methyl-D-erythritol 4-phosphate cytidylyltransferase [Avibacterium paragallinarum]|uniref:2-C-methyl-D-erythritol 4-phosphate cytidylyltransferase n=1 Tax=Avibacterium paragallinarum TaxID=728 RepID=A0A0F5EYL7_AVIPA|nr:2-C-methyl-D-erythritol 4-phosphate cytidylyltransferase [Avibacterium paragallinarum]KAA6208613.1 2-C-methyl-D-erythritol 4-phosphate cytidylyltransferase [Avibacterium paragallinarum]KKB01719.1 2-C-methyl-D-erythritol 4-phosphate cytidylyltransferase [Avibacterium paragallinarum]RZN57613.1 2-C-methyl-D-erythritol 4-phosphate cytidylyltransferase [Avibacterium paragallinarum]RZN70057.1 2-C-methyl-D-erythritol 4-phosphate cytidylyltransferase [Avibacterium paragallinarum]SUV40430.1 2-C-meth